MNIHFATPIQIFSFSGASGTGSFSLTVPDLFVQTGRSAILTAGFSGEQGAPPVPEPATLILLGTGLTGIAAKLRSRKRARAKRAD